MSLALLVLCGPPFAASSSVSTGMPSQTPITALSTLDDMATPGPGSFSPNFAAGSGTGGYAAVPTSTSRGRGDSLTSSSMAGAGGGEGRAVGDVTRALMQVLAVMLPDEEVAGAVPASSGPRAYELLQGLLRDIYVRCRGCLLHLMDRLWVFVYPSIHPIDPRLLCFVYIRQGVDLEKQLLACLKELSRVFNDVKMLEQYQVEALKAATGQGGGGSWEFGRMCDGSQARVVIPMLITWPYACKQATGTTMTVGSGCGWTRGASRPWRSDSARCSGI